MINQRAGVKLRCTPARIGSDMVAFGPLLPLNLSSDAAAQLLEAGKMVARTTILVQIQDTKLLHPGGEIGRRFRTAQTRYNHDNETVVGSHHR